jgi:hypothetical protein
LVERNIDVVDARGSNPLSPTMERFTSWWKDNKSLVLYILIIFLVSRAILSIIGLASFSYLNVPKSMPPWRKEIYQKHPYLISMDRMGQ